MQSINSHLLEERDLGIQFYTHGNAERVCSNSSFQTWHSPQTPSTKVIDDKVVRSSISGQTRQIKTHEGNQFLLIDHMPDLRHSSCHSRKKDTIRSSSLVDHNTGLPVVSSRSISIHSGRRPGQLTSDFYSTYANILRPALINSSVQLFSRPNLSVKMPFKHATNIPDSKKVQQFPGQALTDTTSLAVNVMNQLFEEQKPPRAMHVRGRLLKARLKTLEPVQVEGPTIHQCRGIVAETRAYSACNSRIFQRLKTMLSEAGTSKERLRNQDFVSISESVHRTSEVSCPDSRFDLSFSSDDDDLSEKMLLNEQGENIVNI
uniref:Uncharacterized protein n=1 Tax=Arion vulgaris TaxID=1028688 RepID=A0A0B7AGJ5_9EUPU